MTEQDLQKWAEEYVVAKREADKFKKQVENLNTNIKSAMELLGKEEVELEDGTKVVCNITKRETLDEEKLLVQLKMYAPETNAIQTKEYVDMDILEGEIYRGNLSDEAMKALDSCRNVKEIPTLTIKKSKRGQ